MTLKKKKNWKNFRPKCCLVQLLHLEQSAYACCSCCSTMSHSLSMSFLTQDNWAASNFVLWCKLFSFLFTKESHCHMLINKTRYMKNQFLGFPCQGDFGYFSKVTLTWKTQKLVKKTREKSTKISNKDFEVIFLIKVFW